MIHPNGEELRTEHLASPTKTEERPMSAQERLQKQKESVTCQRCYACSSRLWGDKGLDQVKEIQGKDSYL
jgi:hypothetical protein